jgi:D-alanyl-D-alanine dipeptidase
MPILGQKLCQKLSRVIALWCAFAITAGASAQPATFIDAATVVPGLRTDIRYAGSHNFVGRPIEGYRAPHCLLTQDAANALAEVAHDLPSNGLVLKVFDCYRPTRAVADFVRWAHNPKEQAAKAEFYPDVDKRTLFRDGYIASRSGHSRGSTVDLTLARADDGELDMGTPFDFFSPKSWTADSTVTAEQHANRMRLCSAVAFAVMPRSGGISRCGMSRFPTHTSMCRCNNR